MKERLHKILAHAGVASRRAAEALVRAGRVRVNGRIVTELGACADARRDRIEVDGRRIVLERPVYYLLHKPRGVVTTLRDPEGRPSLGELLAGIPERVYPVGRLDFQTQGALLVTNDGELAEALLHPSHKAPKVYVAKVRGLPNERSLAALRQGVRLDDGEVTAPADVVVLRDDGKNTWLRLTLHEGKNRQIHRMGEAVGHPVLKLHRLSFAGLSVEGLRPGEVRPLDQKEVERLKKTYLLPARARRRKGVAEVRDDERLDAPTGFEDSFRRQRRGNPAGARASSAMPTVGGAERHGGVEREGTRRGVARSKHTSRGVTAAAAGEGFGQGRAGRPEPSEVVHGRRTRRPTRAPTEAGASEVRGTQGGSRAATAPATRSAAPAKHRRTSDGGPSAPEGLRRARQTRGARRDRGPRP